MINNNELLFIVDEQNNPQEPLPRHVAHQNGLWHRTSGIWVINNKGQILCQKRSMKKDTKPGFWEAFFGGHLAPEEEYLDNAIKELSEELGISVEKKKLIPYKILKSDKPDHKEFQFCYAYIIRRADTDFPVEEEEVDEIMWIDFATVRSYLVIEKKADWVLKPWDREVIEWIEQLITE